jgi:hypothetical protein
VAPPTVAGGTIYVGCIRGLICAYSTTDGSLLWSYTCAPANSQNVNEQRADYCNIDAPLVAANGALYVITDDGAFRCFKSQVIDNTAPNILNVTPSLGTAMSGQPPIPISAIIYDESSGVDPSSVQLFLDDEKVDAKFDLSSLTLSYETEIGNPIRPLQDGRHTLKILAKDWKGNEANYVWSFVVDNSLAPRTLPKGDFYKRDNKKTTTKPKSSGAAPTRPKAPTMPRGTQGGGRYDASGTLPPPPPNAPSGSNNNIPDAPPS